MNILICTIDSVLVNATATAVMGFANGPVFPAALSLGNELLPQEVHMASMALM